MRYNRENILKIDGLRIIKKKFNRLKSKFWNFKEKSLKFLLGIYFKK